MPAARTQEVLLELRLIMPARLSDLLAVLPRIMAPLVRALKSSPDLVTLALRTLEYWVDRCACAALSDSSYTAGISFGRRSAA